MATKRLRNGVWQYTIRRKGLLDRPRYFTFSSEAEGDAFCARLEALLDQGVVSPELADGKRTTLRELWVDECETRSEADRLVLAPLVFKKGALAVASISYGWVERWVAALKAEGLAPSTIRHKVGAMSRLLDCAVRKELVASNF